MSYNAKYFQDNLPAWKRQKDPVLSKIFYRPVSFFTASFAANHGISANTVSYCSVVVALLSCTLFAYPSYYVHLLAAVFVSVWLIMDCTDGNLARSVKKQLFGTYADSMSSYIFVGFLITAMGIAVYESGGLFVSAGSVWIIVMGAIASSSDTLMRLIYHKYKATERELADTGVLKMEYDVREDNTRVSDIRVRLENELGIGGILPPAILVCAFANALDIMVIYGFFYYFLSMIAVVLIYTKKAIRSAREHEF